MICSTVLPIWEANESVSYEIIKWVYGEGNNTSHYESIYNFSENSRTNPFFSFISATLAFYAIFINFTQ
jgi:hypothetical protein